MTIIISKVVSISAGAYIATGETMSISPLSSVGCPYHYQICFLATAGLASKEFNNAGSYPVSGASLLDEDGYGGCWEGGKAKIGDSQS